MGTTASSATVTMRPSDEPLTGTLAARLAAPPGRDVTLVWLGQAGFVIDGGGCRIVIDPYLSDSLAEKYAGKAFPHRRMMPAPVVPGGIRHVDAVLATHAHSDHLDPGTLPGLLAANSDAVVIAPESARALVLERSGLPETRFRGVDAGGTVEIAPGLSVAAMRAAHEEIETDEAGRHRFLGLAIRIGGRTILHTGDTIPFAGQVEEARGLSPDLILAPVNGRDAIRRAKGVPGNMSADEALAFAASLGVETVIAHHFDLFDFNTVPRSDLDALANASRGPYLLPVRIDRLYRMEAGGA